MEVSLKFAMRKQAEKKQKMQAQQVHDYGGYTDRKKKIIREWNKTNSSPRPAETLTSDPLRPSYMPGHEFLVTPYAHHAMSRREKRKKQDSLPGGNSLTRDER